MRESIYRFLFSAVFVMLVAHVEHVVCAEEGDLEPSFNKQFMSLYKNMSGGELFQLFENECDRDLLVKLQQSGEGAPMTLEELQRVFAFVTLRYYSNTLHVKEYVQKGFPGTTRAFIIQYKAWVVDEAVKNRMNEIQLSLSCIRVLEMDLDGE